MKQLVGDLAFRVARRLGALRPTTWNSAQAFELHHAVVFMNEPHFAAQTMRLDDPSSYMSAGHREHSLLAEFFGGDVVAYDDFVRHIDGKTVLDIGPCVFTPLSFWDVASRRLIIEPLYDQVVDYQIKTKGQNCFRHIDKAYSAPAERRIAELVGAVDGAVLVRNCIDHSPSWPFILSNITAYMAPGAVLLLWNDLLHPPEYLDGHFDITDDAGAFRRLLEDFGLRVDFEFSMPEQGLLNYGCRATKALAL